MANPGACVRLEPHCLDSEPAVCPVCQAGCIEADVLVVNSATLNVFGRMRVRYCETCGVETVL